MEIPVGEGDRVLHVYFAGGLFDAQQLKGNADLAHAIETHSEGLYKFILPQDIELRDSSPKKIRDQDLANVIGADLALFQFNGTELDSGTVAEYMTAKFADIPTVQVRSDFRSGGDQEGQGDSWNLMLSFYPRNEVVHLNSMALYKEGLVRSQASQVQRSCNAATYMIDETAKVIIKAMDKVIQTKSTMPKELQTSVHEWLATFAGSEARADAMKEETANLSNNLFPMTSLRR